MAWAGQLHADWKRKEDEKKAKAAAAASQPAPAAPAIKKDKVQAGLAAGAIRAAKDGYPVYSVSSDVQGSTGISTFQKATGHFVEVGIAEANMVSTGAGLSKAGYIPIVDTFGQFGITKGNLPLTMAALSQAPVIAMFSHVGFQDAADGASHQATTYLAAVSAIPHTIVIAPSCAKEAESFMYDAIKHIAEERKAGRDGESVIFFVGRENYPVEWIPGATYPWGRAQVIQEGSDVVLDTRAAPAPVRATVKERGTAAAAAAAVLAPARVVAAPRASVGLEKGGNDHGRRYSGGDNSYVPDER